MHLPSREPYFIIMPPLLFEGEVARRSRDGGVVQEITTAWLYMPWKAASDLLFEYFTFLPDKGSLK